MSSDSIAMDETYLQVLKEKVKPRIRAVLTILFPYHIVRNTIFVRIRM